jgi:hypothetical protein
VHAAVWVAVFAFWLLLTRNYHPTLGIGVLATTLLVAAFVGAVYVNSYLLLPRLARRTSWWRYLLSLLAIVVVLDVVTVVLAIQGVYDLLWGPDPLRFGFWFNFAIDGIGIDAHLAAGTLVLNVLGKGRLGRLSGQMSKGA